MIARMRPAKAIDRKNLSGPALRMFFRVAELWGLSVKEQMILLGVAGPDRPSSSGRRIRMSFCPKIRWSGFPTSSASTRHFRFCCPTKGQPTNG